MLVTLLQVYNCRLPWQLVQGQSFDRGAYPRWPWFPAAAPDPLSIGSSPDMSQQGFGKDRCEDGIPLICPC